MSYDVNKAPNRTRYFDLFSNSSNLRSLPVTYMNFAEYVDTLEQIGFAKFQSDIEKDNWYTG